VAGAAPLQRARNPLTDRLDSEGKEHVAIAAGGNMLFGKEPGDALVAFALPDDTWRLAASASPLERQRHTVGARVA
jgi:hypothetical protein